MYDSAQSFWEHYGPRILRAHPGKRYIAVYDEQGMNDRFNLFIDDADLRRRFKEFVSIDTWKGSPVILDMDAERKKLSSRQAAGSLTNCLA
jgi:hypothetical protein